MQKNTQNRGDIKGTPNGARGLADERVQFF